jgi:putative transposase
VRDSNLEDVLCNIHGDRRMVHLDSSFFSYPAPIRKVIYTTNAIESVHASIRKVTDKRGAFPTVDSVRKVLYLAILKASERWRRPIKDWTAALNHLTIVFEKRVPN